MLTLRKNILITGMQGSGKSYLAKKWSELGLNAVDADNIIGLGNWYDKNGNVVEFNKKADEGWLNKHDYLWDQTFLEQYIKNNSPIIILGASGNVLKMHDLFDETYYLKIPANIIKIRLQKSDRKNEFGSLKAHRDTVISKIDESDESMIKLGIKILDGTKTPQEILNKIKL